MADWERRVKAGEKVPAAEKIVSIFEPHAGIIYRGLTSFGSWVGLSVFAFNPRGLAVLVGVVP